MSRLINADALIDFLDVGHLRHPSELCFSEVDVANLLLHAPTISPDEVRGVGKWIQNDNGTWSCSECHSWVPDEQHYYARFCLYCGAKMEVSESA